MKKKVSHTANESTDSDNESSTVSVWRCSPLVPPRLCKWILGAHCSPLCTTWSDGSGLPYSPEQGRKLLLSFCLLLCINSVWWFALCLVLSMLIMVMTECRHGDRQYIYTFYQSEFERLLFLGFERLLFFGFFFKLQIISWNWIPYFWVYLVHYVSFWPFFHRSKQIDKKIPLTFEQKTCLNIQSSFLKVK